MEKKYNVLKIYVVGIKSVLCKKVQFKVYTSYSNYANNLFCKKYVSILGKVQGLKSFPYNFIMGLKSMCINVDIVIAEFVNLQVCTICISMKLDVQMVTFPDFDNK